MSRDIKFRGRKIDNDEWIYGYLYTGFIGSLIVPIDTIEPYGCEYEYGINGCFDVYPDTVGQFTGFKDKNEIDIFEGDIVKYRRIIRKKEVCFEAVIKWDNGFLLHPNKTVMQDHFAIKCSLSSINVIGNIHQHSHLLGTT